MAFRVPTPNVSVVDLTVRLEKPVSADFTFQIKNLYCHYEGHDEMWLSSSWLRHTVNKHKMKKRRA